MNAEVVYYTNNYSVYSFEKAGAIVYPEETV